MITTTLNEIRKHRPCEDEWEKLLKHLGKTEADDEPLPVVTVLDSNNVDDFLWVLSRACGQEGERLCHELACDFAEHVLPLWDKHYPNDKRPHEAIAAKRRWLKGEITSEELAVARAASRDAAWDAKDVAKDVARAAARAASRVTAKDARTVAWDATWAAWGVEIARNADWAAEAERAWQEARIRAALEGEPT